MLRGRPQIPLATAMANGAALQNPTRFEGRIDVETAYDHIPLGMVPPYFLEWPHLVALWSEFNAEFRWLRESDRKLVELACLLMADVRECFQTQAEPSGRGGKPTEGASRSIGMAPNATFSQLRQILGMMGGSPATFGKLLPPKPKDAGEQEKTKKGSRYAAKLQLVK
jgi:hypothetical protein